MEIIVGAVLIILILMLAGLDIRYIIMGIACLVALGALLTASFFAVCWVMLIGSKKKTAQFVRFDRGKRFESAVYLIDGVEYSNIFPAEFIMREKLYHPGRDVSVRLSRNSRVFDKNALMTSAVGLPVSLLIAAAFGGGLLIILL